MDRNLKADGENGSVTASTALLNQRLATLNVPRMLSPYEIELLRKSKEEIGERCRAFQKIDRAAGLDR